MHGVNFQPAELQDSKPGALVIGSCPFRCHGRYAILLDPNGRQGGWAGGEGICRILRHAIRKVYVCHANPREEVSAAGCCSFSFFVSEEASQEIRAKRAGLPNDEPLHVVADSMSVLREEPEAEVVGSAYRVQSRLIETRGNACAMCVACH